MRWNGYRWCFLWGTPSIAQRAFYAYSLLDWPSVVDYLAGWAGDLGSLPGYVSLWKREQPAQRPAQRDPAGWYRLSASYRARLAGFARRHVIERDRYGEGFSTPRRLRAHWQPAPGQRWYDDPLFAQWWSRADLRAARGRGGVRAGETVPVEQHPPVQTWPYLLLVAREEFR
jgi:hypothetical protein